MAFVTDLIWRSPLGLRINAQDTADVLTTEDWVKVRGDQLVRARRRLRPAHHRGAVGDALLRSRLADGRRSSGGHRGVGRRALRRAGADARADRHRPGAAAARRPRRSRAATSASWSRRRTTATLDFAGRGAYQGVTRPHAIELTLPDDGAAQRSAVADRARLGAPDGQLGERGDGAGPPRAAAGPRARGRDRRRSVPRRPGRPRVPVRQGQDGAARSRRRVPGGRHRSAPAAPVAPTSRSSGIASAGRSGGPTCASSRAACRRWPRTCGSAATRRRASRRRARPSGRATCSPARRRAGATSRATTRASATCASCSPGSTIAM